MAIDYKKSLVELLGVEENATDEAITNAAKTFQSDMVAFKTTMESDNDVLRNTAEEAVKAKEAAEAAKTTVEGENKTLREELVNSDIVSLGDIVTNDNRDEIKGQLLSNRAVTLKMLKGIKVAPKTPPAAPLHNLSNTAQPGAVVVPEGSGSTAESEAEAKRISNRARAIMKEQNTSYQNAFIAARAEVAAK